MSENVELTRKIVGAAIAVHDALGPGLLESAYERCLCRELSLRGIEHRRQVELPVVYKGERLDVGYRLDILVEELVVVELKTVDAILPVHEAQVLTYLKLSGLKTALILNFNVPLMVDGVKRYSR